MTAPRRPGRIAELFAFGAGEPERQRAFLIVALGAVEAYPDDYRRIPFLWGSPRVRHRSALGRTQPGRECLLPRRRDVANAPRYREGL